MLEDKSAVGTTTENKHSETTTSSNVNVGNTSAQSQEQIVRHTSETATSIKPQKTSAQAEAITAKLATESISTVTIRENAQTITTSAKARKRSTSPTMVVNNNSTPPSSLDGGAISKVNNLVANNGGIGNHCKDNVTNTAAEILQDLQKSAEKLNTKCNNNMTDGDLKGLDKNHSLVNKTQQVAASVTKVKEESRDLMQTLVNIKKEEGNDSPIMSPVGFASISGDNTVRASKMNGGSDGDTSCPGAKSELDNISSANNKKQIALNNNNHTKQLSVDEMAIASLNTAGDVLGSSAAASSAGGSSETADNMIGTGNQPHAKSSVLYNNNMNAMTDGGSNNSAAQSNGGPLQSSGGGGNMTAATLLPGGMSGCGSGSGIGSSSGGGGGNNCVEYIQQQNHIFVFSTQLANKGADAVLNGQYPTIIAYHCTQPATKNFLEDFFVKNPMKITKMHRQNAMANFQTPPQWLQHGSVFNSLNKVQQQATKTGNNNCNSNMASGGANSGDSLNDSSSDAMANGKMQTQQQLLANLRHHQQQTGGNPNMLAGFTDSNANDVLSVESELMCWDQTSGGAASAGAGERSNGLDVNAAKMLETVETLITAGGANLNKTASTLMEQAATGGIDGSNMPSLQGVKVPDENLTPQQRQHREEQLAKIKKMNQFLFPENDSEIQLSKINAGGLPGGPNESLNSLSANLGSILMNTTAAAGSTVGPNVGGNLAAVQNNLMNAQQNKALLCGNAEQMAADDSIAATIAVNELINTHDMTRLHCGAGGGGLGNKNPVSAGAPGLGGSLADGMIGLDGGGGGNEIGVNNLNLIPNSPELMEHFLQSCGTNNGSSSGGGKIDGKLSAGIDLANLGGGSGGGNNTNGSIEWSKQHHQFFDERLMKNTAGGSKSVGANMRAGASISGANQIIRAAQGPPPPYHQHHPTQRSASVPIATQSPNPASPNNPTSNLSLPSPCTGTNSMSGSMLGMSATSPNINDQSSAAGAPGCPAVGSNNGTSGKIGGSLVLNKFESGNSTLNANARGRNNNVNQFNSNPGTPVHMSPKDLETFAGDLKKGRPSPKRSKTPIMSSNSSASSSLEGNSSGVMEMRFSSSSPGTLFPSHMPQSGVPPGIQVSAAAAAYKASLSGPPFNHRRPIDNMPLNPNSARQSANKSLHQFDPISSLAQMSQQLTNAAVNSIGNGGGGGGTLAMPGSSGGSNSNLMGNLAGMSGSGTNDLSMSSHGSLDMLPTSSLENSVANAAGAMDGSNIVGSNINMSSHVNAAGLNGLPGNGPAFLANAGNHAINSMGHRLLSPKLCGNMGMGNFNPGAGIGVGPPMQNGPMRDGICNSGPLLGSLGPGATNYHGVLPPGHRMMGRININYNNMNMSPNIQVKASTPNTIQYMPVRQQNALNAGNNMRMPPSLEFLQRYTQPHIAGNPNSQPGNMLDGGGVGGPGASPLNPMNTGSGSGGSGNKSVNNAANMMANNVGGGVCIGNALGGNNSLVGGYFAQNCQQMRGGSGVNEHGAGGGDGSIMHDLSGNVGMIRGARPMRLQQQQPNMLSGNPTMMGNQGMMPRLQGSSMQGAAGNGPVAGPPLNPNIMAQFQAAALAGSDTMECNSDGGASAAALFGNNAPSNLNGGGAAHSTQLYDINAQQQQQQHQKNNNCKNAINPLCQNMNLVGGGPMPNPLINSNGHMQANLPSALLHQNESNAMGGGGNAMHGDSGAQQLSLLPPSAMLLGANNNNNVNNNGMLLNNAVGSAANGCNPPLGSNYKNFGGPTTSDLKYAQQYHSFQQQLYATSTRNQHQNIGSTPAVSTGAGSAGGTNSLVAASNNASAAFYLNK